MSLVSLSEKNVREEAKKSIIEIIGKHKELEINVQQHVIRQSSDQQGLFDEKMKERRDRSIHRSMNRSRGAMTPHRQANSDTRTEEINGMFVDLKLNNRRENYAKRENNPFRDNFFG